jgi:hypothetical protein
MCWSKQQKMTPRQPRNAGRVSVALEGVGELEQSLPGDNCSEGVRYDKGPARIREARLSMELLGEAGVGGPRWVGVQLGQEVTQVPGRDGRPLAHAVVPEEDQVGASGARNFRKQRMKARPCIDGAACEPVHEDDRRPVWLQ